MNLSSQLASGACGVRWQPADAELLGDKARGAFWRDAGGVIFQAALSPCPYSLGAGGDVDPVLRGDLEAAARAEFLAHWAGTPEEDRRPARTDDPTWSPIVEVAAVTLSGGPAVTLIRRLSYAPGDEIVVGHVIVPTAKGHVDLAVLVKAGMTGLRESMVLVDEEIDPEMPMPPQSHYDRRELDERFPDHALSVVRRHLDALTTGTTVEVTQPDAARADGEVVLERGACAIVPPPRFAPVAPGALSLSPSLCMLTRPAFGSWIRTFEVWRVGKTASDRRALEQLAARTIADWANEGVTNIRIRSTTLADDGDRLQLTQDVRFVANAAESHSHFHWIADADGAVFRIGAGGHADTGFDQLRAEVAAALPTWRRLDPVEPAPKDKPKRPWWKPW